MILISLAMVFLFVETDAGMGIIQRIFYFHVPVAWVAFFAFFITFTAGIAYLIKRNIFWDVVASVSAEIGLIFTTLVLVTGSIWARSEWGKWWEWEPRLTASLVLWLIYLSYFIIRAYIKEDEQRARFSAVFGIVGFVDVPIVMISVKLASIHPSGTIFEEGLEGVMLTTLLLSISAFTLLYFLFMEVGISIQKDRQELKNIKELLEEKYGR
jgi:heme exporter protein C